MTSVRIGYESLAAALVAHLVGRDVQESLAKYDRAKVPPYNGNELKALLSPPLLIQVQNKGTQGVRRGTSSIHCHCLAPRSSSHIGHGQ